MSDAAWALDADSLAPGDEMPVLELDVTATVIVAGAIATRDFMPVHHDRDYANRQGAPDIFMNILSTNALCSRYLTDWAGPESMVRRLAIRLGAPVFPGSTLTFTGRVVSVTPATDGADALVQVELQAATGLGAHATGTATVALPC